MLHKPATDLCLSVYCSAAIYRGSAHIALVALQVPAIEVNLRWGGTTHPAATLRLLTHGHLDEETGSYLSDKNVEKHYYCTDNLKMPELVGLTPIDISAISAESGLDFNHQKQTGVVFHLMGTLSMYPPPFNKYRDRVCKSLK